VLIIGAVVPDVATATDLYSQISSEIVQLDGIGSWGAKCEIVDKVAADFTFTLGQGEQLFNATVPKEFFNLGPFPGMPGICQAVFEHFDTNFFAGLVDNRPVWLLGAPLLKHYYTVWNALDNTLGFATPKHSKGDDE